MQTNCPQCLRDHEFFLKTTGIGFSSFGLNGHCQRHPALDQPTRFPLPIRLCTGPCMRASDGRINAICQGCVAEREKIQGNQTPARWSQESTGRRGLIPDDLYNESLSDCCSRPCAGAGDQVYTLCSTCMRRGQERSRAHGSAVH